MSEFDLSNPHEGRRAAALQRRGTDSPLNRVRSYPETAEIVGISLATFRRLIKAGKGPRITALSEKRRGVSDRDREAWLEERAGSAAAE
jgi:predicted DNA-binding transcriptional regulator AlpA